MVATVDYTVLVEDSFIRCVERARTLVADGWEMMAEPKYGRTAGDGPWSVVLVRKR